MQFSISPHFLLSISDLPTSYFLLFLLELVLLFLLKSFLLPADVFKLPLRLSQDISSLLQVILQFIWRNIKIFDCFKNPPMSSSLVEMSSSSLFLWVICSSALRQARSKLLTWRNISVLFLKDKYQKNLWFYFWPQLQACSLSYQPRSLGERCVWWLNPPSMTNRTTIIWIKHKTPLMSI